MAAAPLDCPAEVEDAVQSPFWGDNLGYREFWPSAGIREGTVLSVDGQRLRLAIGMHPTFEWPHPLPFPVEPGEAVVVRAAPASLTIYFERGALAFHTRSGMGGPPTRGHRISSIEAELEEGCNSTVGKTLDLVLGDVRIPPGGSAEVEGWVVHNLGLTFTEEEVNCDESVTAASYQGVWIAETTEMRRDCSKTPPPARACSEEVIAANVSGAAHDLQLDTVLGGTNRLLGDYEVTSVFADRISFARPDDEEPLTLVWPGPLPFEIEEGERLRLDRRWAWYILKLPRGQLAFATGRDFSVEFPPRSPGSSASLVPVEGCDLDGSFGAVGLRVRTDEVDEILLPGQEARLGKWTYRLLFSREAAPTECWQGPQTYVVGEGLGEYSLIAFQLQEPEED